MFSVTFDFECTYIKEIQYNCNVHRSVHLFIIAISSHSHKEWKEPQFLINFFPTLKLNREILVFSPNAGGRPATLLKREFNTGVFL